MKSKINWKNNKIFLIEVRAERKLCRWRQYLNLALTEAWKPATTQQHLRHLSIMSFICIILPTSAHFLFLFQPQIFIRLSTWCPSKIRGFLIASFPQESTAAVPLVSNTPFIRTSNNASTSFILLTSPPRILYRPRFVYRGEEKKLPPGWDLI